MAVKTFGNKKLVISTLSSKDLKCAKEYKDFINELIEEDAMILMNVLQTVKDEELWVASSLKAVKAKKKVFLVARDGKRIVANTSFELNSFKRNHVAKMGIAVRKDYRGQGLGNYIMAKVMKLARKTLKPGPKILQLEVYEGNKPAIALYKKMGFKIVARVPKQIQHKGKLIAEYIMQKPA